MNAILAIIADDGQAIGVIYREGVEIIFFSFIFFNHCLCCPYLCCHETSKYSLSKYFDFNSLTAIDGHDRQLINELLCSFVTSMIFVRC